MKHRLLAPLLAVGILLPSACGGSTELLGARVRFRGAVVIRVDDPVAPRELKGELEFDRARDTFAWRTGAGTTAVELRHDAVGGLQKTRGGEPVATELSDELDFTLLSTLVRAELPRGATVERRAHGYTLTIGDRRLWIDWTAEADGNSGR